MKKSELRQIIREEIQKLNEAAKVSVEADNGKLIFVDVGERAKHIVSQMKNDKKPMSKAWDYIDSGNRFFRVSPKNPKAIGRVTLNQLIYDFIKKNKLTSK